MKPGHQRSSAFAGTLLLMSSCFGAPANTEVTAVRFWTLNDATRVVIETTGEFTFTSDRAFAPDRDFLRRKGSPSAAGFF